MSIGKRLINTGAGGATPSCTTDTTDIFDDGYGIALYSLDYDASTAPDATTDYSGTPSNVEFGTDGHINWGAKFNGSSSKISLPNGSFQNTILSVSAWINVSNTSSTRTIIETYGYSGSSKGWLFRLISGKLQFDGYNGDPASTVLKSNESIPLNTWTHVAVVFSANTKGELYINGSEVTYATQTVGTVGYISNEAVNIGTLQGTGVAAQDYFIGSIDQVRIFNRALDSTEVGTLYAETACVYTATTDTQDFPTTNFAYYQLDSSAVDSHSGTYNGTESNITYEFGRFGTAAVFNGSNSYISTGINFSTLPDTKSFSMWVKSTGSSSVGFGGMSGSGVNNGLFVIDESAGDLSYIPKFGGYHNGDASNIITNGWNHFVVTDTNVNGNVKMYINGDEVTVTKINSTSYIDNTDMQIGRQKRGNGLTFWQTGTIDQVRVFSSELTDIQVEGLFNDEKQAYITKNASNPFGDGNEVAFYKMENNTADSTGSNTGTNYGATFTTTDALFGTYSASFNGSSSMIIVRDIFSSSPTQCSVSVWVKADDWSPSSNRNVLDLGDPNTSLAQNRIFLSGTSPHNIFVSINGGDGGFAQASQSFVDGSWHHIVATYNVTGGGVTNGVKVYIDGSLADEGNSTESFNNLTDLAIGVNEDTSNRQFWDGDIDQVRIFDRALEGDEVFKLYAEVIN